MPPTSELTVDITQADDLRIVELSGSVDTSSAEVIRRRIAPLCEMPGSKVLIDCRNVGYLNSSCFGQFSHLHRLCAEHGGKLVLCSLDEAAREIMDLLGLLKTVQVVRTRKEGLAALE